MGILDSEESKNVAIVHKTNQGYSGKDLWRLKQERPELFGGAAPPVPQDNALSLPSAPAGFVRNRELPGWLYSSERNMYFRQETGQFYCRDAATGEFYEFHKGEDLGVQLCIRGDAAGRVGPAGLASRHVMIGDLHRAAAAMKLDLSHLDSPSAMFAVYDSRAGGGPMIEAAAKGLHGRLLPRLAAYRGEWDEARLQAVIAEAIETLRREIGAEGGIGLAVALLLGRHLTLAAARGAVCRFFVPEGMDASTGEDDIVGEGAQAATHYIDLAHFDTNLGVLLTVDGVASKLGRSRLHALVRHHMAAERPKAACLAVLEEAMNQSADAPLVATAIRLGWSQQDDLGEPVPKKSRVEVPKVRIRHILLRHVGSQVAAGERIKKRPSRTQGEAEAQMFKLFLEVANGGDKAFTAQCRAASECDTALRGGDLSGDLGWLDRDPAKNRKVPASVVRAAFALAVGQLSDVVSSERGVHLLLRSA